MSNPSRRRFLQGAGAATAAAAAAGVGPAVVAYRESPPCLVTAFIPGLPVTAEGLREPGALADVAAALEEDRAQAVVADAATWGPAGIMRLAALARVFQASLHVAGAAHPIATAFAAHIARATPAATCIAVQDELFPFATRATPGLGIGLALDHEGLAQAQRIAVTP